MLRQYMDNLLDSALADNGPDTNDYAYDEYHDDTAHHLHPVRPHHVHHDPVLMPGSHFTTEADHGYTHKG